MLCKQFPGSHVVTHFLGSDINEQVFAFVRLCQFFGRRTNLDCITLAYGLEKRNVFSTLSGEEFLSSYAHTRGRQILFPTVPLPDEGTPVKEENTYSGSSIKENDLKTCADKATTDCLKECQRLNLDFFLKDAAICISCTKASSNKGRRN